MPVCAYRGSCARLPAWHPAGAGRRFERVSETYAWAYRLQRCGLNGVDTPHGRALFALVNASAPAASSEPSPPPPPLHRSPARRGSHRPCRAPVTGLRSGLGAVGLLERWEESAAAGLKRHLRPICPMCGHPLSQGMRAWKLCRCCKMQFPGTASDRMQTRMRGTEDPYRVERINYDDDDF